MNKTVNINIGGFFFHIDEDAYQMLQNYLNAVEKSLNNSVGKDEIMKDIEMRIAELLSQRQSSDKQVISISDIEFVKTIMGQPEDYQINDEDEPKTQKSSQSHYSWDDLKHIRPKKLYRDMDTNILGGIAAGLSHYFGIEALWIRALFLLFLFMSGGTFGFLYVLAWILIPEAVTTSQRLEMRGEPVNLSNIEKKVKEGYEKISEDLKKIDYDKYQSQAKSGMQAFGNQINEVFKKMGNLLGKLIGAFILLVSVSILTGLAIGFIFLGTASLSRTPITEHINLVLLDVFPLWLVVVTNFLLIAIPLIFILKLGLRLLFSNIKPFNKYLKISLWSIWFIALVTVIVFGLRQSFEFASESKTFERQTIDLTLTDTLKVELLKINPSEIIQEDWADFQIVQNQKGEDMMYFNDVNVGFDLSSTNKVEVEISRKARGINREKAKKRAELIEYNYTFDKHSLLLNDYYLSPVSQMKRGQHIYVKIYIPEGMHVKPKLKTLNWWFQNLNYPPNSKTALADMVFVQTNNGLHCSNCEVEETDIQIEE